MSRRIALLGDGSSHGGSLVSANQDGRFTVAGTPVCAHGCSHSCPIPGHGVTPVSAVTTRSRVNGRLIVTEGAVAGCGAVVTPPERSVGVE